MLGMFCLLLQFHLLILAYSGFLLLLDSVVEDFMFLEMCPFHPGFQISWHLVLIVISYNALYFVVSGVISPLSFLIVFIWVLSLFFLMSLLKGFISFLIF